MIRSFSQPTIFWRPAIASVVLHVLVITGMSINWASRSEVAVTPKILPRHIEAWLVDASSLKPKKKKVVARKPTRVAAPRQVTKPAPRVTPKSTPKAAASKPKPTPPPEEVKRPSAAEQQAQAQQELALALDAEDILQAQADDRDVAQSYVALISQTVQNNWSRPPSARNGMETELIIQLIPTGEVVSVTVARSSGQLAFDRSAVNAVRKAERFPELQRLPARVFEKSFRQFRLLFKPEDLRY